MFRPGTASHATKREREVLLSLISEGCSNQQGALGMSISPRTSESDRAEAMGHSAPAHRGIWFQALLQPLLLRR